MEIVFHQSGPADRKMFVRPPKESKLPNELWLLLLAGYGFIIANSKWQFKSNNSLTELGLQHVSEIPQLLVKRDEYGSVILPVINIVDDILSCRADDDLKLFVHQFGRVLKFGAVSHDSGKLRFYGLSIFQADEI